MNRNKAILWLYEELPLLEEVSVITPAVAEQIRAHYGQVTVRSKRQMMILALSILGASLIGLGIILLIAHNWQALSRPARVILSFAPLLTGQALVAWTLVRGRESLAWREGSGIFLALAIGASISLISQTYHISGSLESFLLTWLLLGGPLIYFLNATSVALLYMAGLTMWIFNVDVSGETLLFWPLAAFLLPHIRYAYKSNPGGIRMFLLSWAGCITFPLAMGVIVEDTMRGAWMLVYGGMFSAMLLAGRLVMPALKVNALVAVGFAGSLGLSLLLTYQEMWPSLKSTHFLYNSWNPRTLQGDCFVVLMILVILVLTKKAVVRREYVALGAGGLPLLSLLGVVANICDFRPETFVIAFNAYVLCWGGLILLNGLSRDNLLLINLGMAVLALLIAFRFFDAQMGIMMRGILFIVLGFSFLGVNLVLSFRKSAKQESGR